MRNSDDRNKDDDKTTQRDIDRSLAHKLLSEEELRYFAGEDKPPKSSKMRFFKRWHVSSRSNNSATNEANISNAAAIDSIAADKLAVVSAQQSRGAEILIAMIVLILFVSAAGFFLFNTNAPDESLVDAVSNLKDTEAIDGLNEVVTLNVDNLTSNNEASALVDESAKLLATFDSDQTKTAIVAATNNEDSSSSTIGEIIPQKTDLPEQPPAISFEEFAAEAETTVYREEK